MIAHNHTYTGNVCSIAVPDIACCHPEHCGHDANPALNPIDADDKTTCVVKEPGTLVKEAVEKPTVVPHEDIVVSYAEKVMSNLCATENTLDTTVPTGDSTDKGHVHEVDGDAHHCIGKPKDHGKPSD